MYSKYSRSKKKRLSRSGRAIVMLIISVLVLVGLVFLHNADFWGVQSVQIEGNDIVEKTDLLEIVEEVISGKRLFVLDANNVAFISKVKIREMIFKTFERVETVNISRSSMTSILVTVHERRPAAMWCDDEDGERGCYFIDEEGYLYAKSPEFSGNVYLKFFGHLEGEPLGQTYVSSEIFNKLISYVEIVGEMGFETTEVMADEEGDFTLRTAEVTDILISTNTNPLETIDNLQITLDEIGYFSDDPPILQYIDLRFGNKVFYKDITE